MRAEGQGTPAGGEREPDPQEERRLAELLRGLPAPAAGEGFRAALRAAFARGALAPKDAASPSLAGLDRRSAAGVIEALLEGAPPPPPARPAFREGLKRRFARGELVASGDSGEGARLPGPLGPRRAAPGLRLLAGGLAAAAALWLVWVAVAPRGATWRARLAEGEGPLLVDGREVEVRDLSLLGPAFAEARVIASRGRRVELVREDELVLALLPGAEIETLADGTQGAHLRFALRSGEVYLKSREQYAGPPVVVQTPDADMRMTGTVVGILYDGALSCVCVARGAVEVEPRLPGVEPGARACRADHRHVVFAGGEERADAFADLPEQGGAHVADLRAFAEGGFP